VAGELDVIARRKCKVTRDVLKGVILRPEFLISISGIGFAGEAALARSRSHPKYLLGVSKRQWTNQDRIHHTEDRDVGADAESQDQHRNDGERAIAPQCTKRVGQVLHEDVESGKAAGFALLFLGLHNSSKSNHGLTPGLVRRQAAAKIIFNRELKMRIHFIA